jgi:hypothetical protein
VPPVATIGENMPGQIFSLRYCAASLTVNIPPVVIVLETTELILINLPNLLAILILR